jgi:hypothetical protein
VRGRGRIDVPIVTVASPFGRTVTAKLDVVGEPDIVGAAASSSLPLSP